MTRNYGYFRSHGVPEVPSMFPFGSQEAAKVFTGRLSLLNVCNGIYKQYKQLPMVGYFVLDQPILMINDLELVKHVLIKDFDHFIDRRTFDFNESVELNRYFANMLLMMKGEKWKQMRSTLSPVFTSGKLKAMTQMISKVGEDLGQALTAKSTTKEEFDCKELMVNYMLDSIVSCGFGVEANSLSDPESRCKLMAIQLLNQGKNKYKSMIKFLMAFSLPKLFSIMRLSIFDHESSFFFIDIIRQTMKHRKEHNIRRNDFIDLTLDALRNEVKQVVEEDQFEKDAIIKSADNNTLNITYDDHELYLISSLFFFFLAGLDTSSTIMAVTCYYLAKHPEIQERLFNEINDNICDDDLKDLDYNKAHSLPYLDMVVNEMLRIYPIAIVERKCTKEYKVPGTEFTIPVGMIVQIPSGAIMNDPQYFNDPEVFNPENFSPENKKERNPYTFLAFGQGPRNCIGMRFALMNVKICLIRVIKDFKVVPTPKTVDKLVVDPMSTSALPIGGIWVKVEKRSE